MPGAIKYATGKYAHGICDVCGGTYKLLELRGTTVRGKATGLLSCPICWDADHPQNFLPEVLHVDAVALRVVRPDDYGASRQMRHWRPSDALSMALTLGQVEVLT